MNQILRW
ncbi:hypothetical protein AX774_g2291, partial [Zancudomyces culisetae]